LAENAGGKRRIGRLGHSGKDNITTYIPFPFSVYKATIIETIRVKIHKILLRLLKY
jgi:hypothetical protein